MSLFDYNTYNIENFTESSGGWFKTIVTVFGGFVLKTAYDEWNKRKEVTEAGETFEYQLKGLKLAIKTQAETIYKKIKSRDLQDKIQMPVEFTDNFRVLRAVKELNVVKYYTKQIGEEKAAELVYKRYNQIKILELEIERLKSAVGAVREKADNLVYSYRTAHDKNKQAFTDYAKRNTIPFLQQDEFFQKFIHTYEAHHPTNKISMPRIMEMGNTYHLEIEFPPLNNHDHTLYNGLNKFRLTTRASINEFQSNMNNYEQALNIVLESLKELYKAFYNEEIALKKQDG